MGRRQKNPAYPASSDGNDGAGDGLPLGISSQETLADEEGSDCMQEQAQKRERQCRRKSHPN